MKKIMVIPRKGLRVKHPDTRRDIAAEGELVEENTYWKRRVLEGDVTIEKKNKSQKKIGDR